MFDDDFTDSSEASDKYIAAKAGSLVVSIVYLLFGPSFEVIKGMTDFATDEFSTRPKSYI